MYDKQIALGILMHPKLVGLIVQLSLYFTLLLKSEDFWRRVLLAGQMSFVSDLDEDRITAQVCGRHDVTDRTCWFVLWNAVG
jgi:hypothetical protein